MESYTLTPDEKKAMAEATPEMWAEAARDCAKDPEFWKELGSALVTGFLRGLERGLNK
jgi:hypothetical protein